jgi:hypothetical protein
VHTTSSPQKPRSSNASSAGGSVRT